MKCCSAKFCARPVKAMGLCGRHYQRKRQYGDPDTPAKIRGRGEGHLTAQGYIRVDSGTGLRHIQIAEATIGRRLRKNEVVHHINEVKSDNRPENLVVCTREYHALIHARMRALAASGNANWRKCTICKRYDDPTNLYRYKGKSSGFHRECRSNYDRARIRIGGRYQCQRAAQ